MIFKDSKNDIRVLRNAVNNAANNLGISSEKLKTILDCKFWSESLTFEIDSELGKQCILFIKFYRYLYSTTGGDFELMKTWINSKNNKINQTPLDLLMHSDGINKTLILLEHYSK